MRDRIIADAEAALNSKDFKRAVSLLTSLANAGDAEAQFRLGNLYFEGVDMPSAVAYEWLKKAADQNHPEASYKLACFTGSGNFILNRTDEEVRMMLLKAAELGSVSAQCSLGSYYATGDWSGPRNLEEAAKWYGRAASAGNPDAQYELGFMLLLGEGVEKDTTKAFSLIEEAAKQRHEDAVRLLVDVYRKGSFGIVKNAELADYWAKVATEEVK